MKNILFAAAVIFMLSSCATILRGPNQVLKIKDLPTDSTVTVYHNGANKGNTQKVKVSRSQPGTLTIKQEGCATQEIKLDRRVSAGFIILDVVTGIVPLAVDLGTGALYKTKDIQYIPDCKD
jgi:hypothetical protein